MAIVWARSARINGRGSAAWKWVSGLTKREAGAVRGGGLVVVRDPEAWHWKQSGFKVVLWTGKRYIHREPTAGELRIIRRARG